MGIIVKIHNVKNIDDFNFEVPVEKGLYALTGENGSGKSTVISCAAAAFYVPSFEDYFGNPREGAYIEFDFNGRKRSVKEKDGEWKKPSNTLGITGFYEGSIVFGNRFKDIDYSLLGKLATIKFEQLNNASDFVKKSLGSILHDDEDYYQTLYVLKNEEAKRLGLQRSTYYFKNKGALISQLNMSTGENLLLTILSSIERRLKKKVYGETPAFMFLDEVELALHSSALRRLVFFLKDIAEKNNTVVLFSTHSIELIRSISSENIFYLQRHVDNSIEVINPCYPVYATRNLESSNYGHDYIIMVEDDLAKTIVERILRDKRLLSNKRVLVISVGGWTQVLRFAYDTIRSNLALSTTKILMVLDRDIKDSVAGFIKKEKMGFSNKPSYLPIKSLEKYLLEKLVKNVDIILFRELNDYLFQAKSLDAIIKEYNTNVKNGVYTDLEKISNGKMLYETLKHELRQIRKTDSDLVAIIVDYLFGAKNAEIEELSSFFEQTLK
ncbi:MAG: ATP-binding protein [Lachnospiraceae bacterium]|nr:ATP-binding protein [Lachnospiraceae bacterium]